MSDERPLIERMKKGGRLNPNDPHVFVPTPGVERYGTRNVPSKACAICGGSDGPPLHIPSDSTRHGFGQ